MVQLFQDDTEKAKHEDAIDRLCQENPDHAEFIRRTYLEILEKVSAEATIRTYLTILISKEVKALLKMKELSKSNLRPF
jgi:hypothetical protein